MINKRDAIISISGYLFLFFIIIFQYIKIKLQEKQMMRLSEKLIQIFQETNTGSYREIM